MVEPVTRLRNSVLIDPEDSCLLFIDFDDTRPKAHPSAPKSDVGPSHHEVLGAAVDLFVPAFLSFMVDDRSKYSRSTFEAHIPKEAQMPRLMVNPWRDECLRTKILEQDRHRLILAGSWSEGSLVQAALGALADAYDVYVLFDLSNGLQELHNSPVAVRMVQAGVVPLTSRQLILEWSDSEGPAFTTSA